MRLTYRKFGQPHASTAIARDEDELSRTPVPEQIAHFFRRVYLGLRITYRHDRLGSRAADI